MTYHRFMFCLLFTVIFTSFDCKPQENNSIDLYNYLKSEGWTETHNPNPEYETVKYENKSMKLYLDYTEYCKSIYSHIIVIKFPATNVSHPELMAKDYLYRYRIELPEWFKIDDANYLWKSKGKVPGVEKGKWVTRDGYRIAYVNKNDDNIKILIGLFENADSTEVKRIMANSYQIWRK